MATPYSAAASCFAAVTYRLPGPNILSTAGTESVPRAMAATACAPPAFITVVMPSSWATNRIMGLIEPSAWGGVHTTICGQPARRAGTPSMSKVLNSGAEPPGTYSPTRCTGTDRREHATPGMVSTRSSGSRCAAWKASMLALACKIAACKSAGTCAGAAANSASETRRPTNVALSSSAAKLSKAASPCSWTWAKMPRTREATCGASAAAGRWSSSLQVLGSG